MRKIAVEVEQLESCAARMEEKNQDYLHHCDLLFQSVETMSNAWMERTIVHLHRRLLLTNLISGSCIF